MVMQLLLEIADTTRRHDYQPQIHAINILTQIFKDRELAVEVEDFTVNLFKIVIEGFKSEK
jgi:hypothetical protein